MMSGYLIFFIVMKQNTYASRVVEIQDELKMLVQARDRLLKDLTKLKVTLESHRKAGSTIRHRALQILDRLAGQIDQERPQPQSVDSDDKQLIQDLDASRAQLEHDVSLTERRLKLAQFEADSLAEMLEELEDQVAEIASDLDGDEDGVLNERH